MLKLNLQIKNIFSKNPIFDSKFIFYGKLNKFKSKYWELQGSYCNYNLLELNLDLNWSGQDHAGPELELAIFGYSIRFKIYDSRHWAELK